MKKYIIIALSLFCFNSYATKINASTFGYNTTNSTVAFRNAIQSQNDTIVVNIQTSDWKIGPVIFFNLQNKVIIFEKNVKLKAVTGVFGIDDCLLQFTQCNNIKLIGYQAEFVMNKPEYASLNNSEFRHCLALNNCVNFSILGLTFRDSGGDGIYIGGETNGNNLGYCDTVFIEDVQCINNYRQGMSIISVQNMILRNSSFSDTIGTLPEAGIDIEPNAANQRVKNLNIESCSFTNNGFSGISVGLFNLKSSSTPVSINVKDCFFKNNCRPGNTYSKSEIFVGADDFDPVQGNLLFERCFIEKSNYSAYYSRKTNNAFATKFKNCVFQNVSQLQIPNNNPIFLEVPSYSLSSPNLGGYIFENVYISYPTNFNFFRVFGAPTLQGIANISGNFTVVEPNNNPRLYTDVPQQTNITFTNNNQTSLPITNVSINSTQNEAIECNSTLANYTFSRTSTSINYPIGLSYTKTGTVTFGDDVHLMTNGAVIPANETSKTETILARKDLISEPNENISLSISPSNAYTITANSNTNLIVKDCSSLYSKIFDTNSEKLVIYPNPATNSFSVQVPTYIGTKNIQVDILDVLGRKVKEAQLNNNFDLIDVSNLKTGTYVVQIIVNDTKYSGKLLVQ
jgi:Secretion system C-terminal sorting domain/Right handed beta helix region